MAGLLIMEGGSSGGIISRMRRRCSKNCIDGIFCDAVDLSVYYSGYVGVPGG